MLFNSLTFIVFLIVVLGIDRALPSWRARKCNLLILSYLFYAAWNPPFVVLLWFSTIVDWFAAKHIAAAKRPEHKRILLFVSLLCNLGLLSFFKYGEFILDNFIQIARTFNIIYEPLPIDIILPIGISFYTFQTLSYTIDVFRGKQKPADSFIDFALYVTFFPQLVAGPIVRASVFLPQCASPRSANREEMSWGFVLFIFGLFQKVVLADSLLSPIADKVYVDTSVVTWTEAWIGTLAFSGQIFFDFAGYSLCAIGVAKCLGFNLPDNFRCPYAAIGFSDFWRRWHISLSTWLRDYLYIPLGGSQKGSRRTYINLMLTMLIGGIWHGASWRFVVWGGLHGIYLIIERLIRGHWSEGFTKHSAVRYIILQLMTFILVTITWVFFRATDFPAALSMIFAMIRGGGPGIELTSLEISTVIGVITAMLGAQYWCREMSLNELVARFPNYICILMLTGLLVALFFTGGDDRSFIYFQF